MPAGPRGRGTAFLPHGPARSLSRRPALGGKRAKLAGRRRRFAGRLQEAADGRDQRPDHERHDEGQVRIAGQDLIRPVQDILLDSHPRSW
jgi:hypothetical protein